VLTRRPIRTALATLVVSGLVLAGSGPASAGNPETDKNRTPDQDAGYFLGYPSPTYSWHGCTATSTTQTPATLDNGVPKPGKGTKQAKVTWTVTDTAAATSGYVVRWKVAQGWKICGVQLALRGSHPDAPGDLAMEAGYTSKPTKGSTVLTGSETVKVKVSKDDVEMLGLERAYGGKKYAISAIYGITAFIRKK
jgi:hypothetical protein